MFTVVEEFNSQNQRVIARTVADRELRISTQSKTPARVMVFVVECSTGKFNFDSTYFMKSQN